MINKKLLNELSLFLNVPIKELKKLDQSVQDLPGYAKWINIAIDDWNLTRVNQQKVTQIEKWFKENDKYIFELADVHSQDAKKKIIKQVLEILKRNNVKKYLDYGGGIGQEVLVAASQKIASSMADLPSLTFDFAKWRADKNNLKIHFIEIKSERPLKGKYNAISCFEVLQHLYNPKIIANHFVEHLTKGGLLILTTRFNNPNYPMALKKNYKFEEGMVGFLESQGMKLFEKIYQYGEGERKKYLYIFKKI